MTSHPPNRGPKNPGSNPPPTEIRAAREAAGPGRPSEMSGGKKVNTYLDAESISIAARLGNGNVSEGIRKALKQAAE